VVAEVLALTETRIGLRYGKARLPAIMQLFWRLSAAERMTSGHISLTQSIQPMLDVINRISNIQYYM